MDTGNKTVFFYVTEKGRGLADALCLRYPGALILRFSKKAVGSHWTKGARLVFIMAAGIVVRTIAPHLADKRTDPAVVVMDEAGRHAVSLAGGHVGGANALAAEIARLTGGSPVITTASDVSGLPALDLWAEAQGLVVEDRKRLPKTATKLLNRGVLRFFSDVPLEAPPEFQRADGPADAEIVVTNRKLEAFRLAPSSCGPKTSSLASAATAVQRQRRSRRP